MKAKLQQLQKRLSQGFVGRDEIMKSALLGVIAGENTLLIGPPGTAKSMLARRVSEAIRQDDTQDYFEYLLTKFSTPEEIFGPLSISELKQDRFQRNTTGYLPSVKIGFLDEIFKASSSILNALLTILNERKYHNGTQSVDVPLQSLISASNELPIGQEELSALYDRFLIRRFVGYVGQEQLSALFDLPKIKAVDEQVRLTVDELKQIREQAKNVQFGNDVRQAIKNIWKECQSEFKEDKSEQLSDRRFVKVLHLMRISAITNGRNAVDFSDILLLKDCLWNNPDNQEKILHIIKTELKKYDKLVDDVDSAEQLAVRIDDEPIPTVTKTPSQNVIQGFQGSGTADDPILIEHINHLQRLTGADIASKGYYFKQMYDIDCRGVDGKSWNDMFVIDFKGDYNGNGKKISYNNGKKVLFNSIEGSIRNLKTENLALAENILNSEMINCHSNSFFIISKIDNCKVSDCSSGDSFSAVIVNSKIHFCQIGRHLATEILSSEIKYCQAKSILVVEKVQDTSIEDCQINLKNSFFNKKNYNCMGGIASEANNSDIKRCYVDGYFEPYYDNSILISGIVHALYNKSSVQYCCVGKLSFKNPYVKESRISDKQDKDSYLIHNISISTNHWGRNQTIAGNSGMTILLTSFTQHYFENVLGWDFKKIWQWDKNENRPKLRTRSAQKVKQNDSVEKSGLLRQQIQSNIWL